MCTVLNIQAAENVKVGNLWFSVDNDRTWASVIAVPKGKEDTYTGAITIPATISVPKIDDPETIIDVPVTSIYDNAFKGAAITSVEIGTNITSIGSHAFDGSTITQVKVPSSVTEIRIKAFDNCNRMEKACFESIQHLVSIDFYLASSNPLYFAKHLFLGDFTTEVTSLVIPDDVPTIGRYSFVNCTSINNVNIPGTVTKIDDCAFQGCSAITDLVIPEGVVTIGGAAFADCTGLKTVKIASTAYVILDGAFENDTQLEKATFNSVNDLCRTRFWTMKSNPLYYAHILYIGDEKPTTIQIPQTSLDYIIPDLGPRKFFVRENILAGCTSIKRVDIPVEADSIAPNTFYGCTGLQYASYGELNQLSSIKYGNTYSNPQFYAPQILIGGQFPNRLVIDSDVNDNAFANAKWLEIVELKEGVKHIGANAFNGCTNLTTIKIPTTLQTIGDKAFWACVNMSAPELEKATGLESIGVGAFHDCKSSSFKTINIPSGCIVGASAFELCINLQTVSLPDGMEKLSNNVFDKCTKLTTVTIPASVTSIEDYAFRNCARLTSIMGAEGVETIGEYAFAGCTGFTDLEIPSNVYQIKKYAFSGCNNIKMVSLPASVGVILDNAFNGCEKLENVFCHGDAPTIGNDSFGGLQSGMTFYVDTELDRINYKKQAFWNGDDYKIVVKTTNNLRFFINDEMVKTIHQDGGTTIDATDLPELEENVIFSGWDKVIPSTMPSKDTDYYGYVSTIFDDGTYKFHILPAEKKNGNNLNPRAILLNVTKELTASDISMTVPDDVSCTWNVTVKIPGEDDVIITYNDESYPVESIGPHAFEGKTTIQQITLPTSVKEIGNAAFKGCSGLMRVNNFNNITQINDSVFFNCTALYESSITLSENLTKIGRAAFTNCSSLDLNNFPTSLQAIGYQALANTQIKTITLASTITLGDEVFKGCKELKTVTFAEGYDKPLPKLTFWNCTALENITLRGDMQTIKERAFDGCTKLSTIILPEGFITIENSAFIGCTQLTNVTLPSTFVGIGTKAFTSCASLSQISVEGGTVPFGTNDTFEQTVYDNAYLFVNNPSIYKTSEPWSKFQHIFKREEYTLTYMQDGNVIDKKNIMVGTPIVAKEEPTDGSREFSGWQGEPKSMPGENTIVIGNFKYELQYYENSVDENNRRFNNEEFKFFYGDQVVLPLERLTKDEYKYTLTFKEKDSEEIYGAPVFEDDAATTDMEMPAKDLYVIVTYEKAEYDYPYNNVNYKVYTMEKEKRAEVISAVDGAKTVTIPATITYTDNKSYPVTLIRPKAFQGNQTIEAVTINDGVSTIGDLAFQGCKKLTTVNLPTTLDYIGQQAFSNTDIRSVTVPYATEMGKEIFYWCTKLNNIEFSPSLTTVPERMFQNCTNLPEDFVIPEQITEIGDYALQGCSSISHLTLPSTIQKLGNYAFYGVLGKDDILEVNGTTLPIATENTFDSNAYTDAVLKTSASTTDDPWRNFVNVEGSNTDQCAKPTITYQGGKLKFTFEPSSFEPGGENEGKIKDGVTIISKITINDTGENSENEVELSKNYIVTAYAKKNGCRRSETVTKTFQFMNGDVDLNGEINIVDAQLIVNKIVGKVDALSREVEINDDSEEESLDPQ